MFSTCILFLLLFGVGQFSVTGDNSCYPFNKVKLVKEVCRIMTVMRIPQLSYLP